MQYLGEKCFFPFLKENRVEWIESRNIIEFYLWHGGNGYMDK